MWSSSSTSLEFIHRLLVLLETRENSWINEEEQIPLTPSEMREIHYLRRRLEAMTTYWETWETRKHTTFLNQRNAFWWGRRLKDLDGTMMTYLLPAFENFSGTDEELARMLLRTLEKYVEEQRRKEDGVNYFFFNSYNVGTYFS